MNESIIEVKNISKVFKLYNHSRDRLKEALSPLRRKYHHDYRALEDISFEIKQGESLSIIGKNGSGKSTLLKILTGVLTPSSGTVRVKGRIAALLELGAGFNPELTGYENIFFQGAILGFNRKEMEDRLPEIIKFADIGEFINQPVKTYSSGMFARLAFSISINVEPEILIVDEALAVGDALFQKRCYKKMKELLSSGVTIILVTHDQEVVRTMTSKAVLLSEGKLQYFGSSTEALLQYRRLLHKEEVEKSNTGKSGLDATSGQERNSQYDFEFGTKEVELVDLKVLNNENEVCTSFTAGEIIKIKILAKSHIDTDNLNVSIRIRSKEGFKIYSWGTLNQDMRLIAKEDSQNIFWRKNFSNGQEFEVELAFVCRLGANFYVIEGIISKEEQPDYSSQKLLHWVDEAAFFSVTVPKNENFFGGIVDLGMTAKWQA